MEDGKSIQKQSMTLQKMYRNRLLVMEQCIQKPLCFIALDLETQKRTVKKSGEWLRKVTEEHGYIAKDSYQ